jgi:NAD(P)-dependent dehydrogenase (short-subunit alcohol dehydrogenase family)
VFAGVLSEESGRKLVAGLSAADSAARLIPIVMDVTKQEDVERAVEVVVSSKILLRAVVNNAGISAFGWSEHLPMDMYERNMNVNFFGTVRTTKLFLPLLRKHHGRLINMGSIGARMPSAFGSSYLATKAAMSSYNDCIRQEVHRFGVSVSIVEPGFFATELLQNGAVAGAAAVNSATRTRGMSPAAKELIGVYPKYAAKMEATKKPIEMMEWLNGSLSNVTDCVVDGIVNRFPLATYTVGYDARMIRHFLSYAPSWIVDVVQTAQD